jgi:hypothetical protein
MSRYTQTIPGLILVTFLLPSLANADTGLYFGASVGSSQPRTVSSEAFNSGTTWGSKRAITTSVTFRKPSISARFQRVPTSMWTDGRWAEPLDCR